MFLTISERCDVTISERFRSRKVSGISILGLMLFFNGTESVENRNVGVSSCGIAIVVTLMTSFHGREVFYISIVNIIFEKKCIFSCQSSIFQNIRNSGNRSVERIIDLLDQLNG